MTNTEDLKKLFTGSEIDCSVLKELLEENQIACLIKNDSNSAKAAGFGVSLNSEAHVYVAEKDMEKSKELLQQFKNSFEK